MLKPFSKYHLEMLIFDSVIFFQNFHTGSKPYTPPPQFCLSLSNFGPNLLVNSQHVWNISRGIFKYSERVFRMKHVSYASFRLQRSVVEKIYFFNVNRIRSNSSLGVFIISSLDMRNFSDIQVMVYTSFFQKINVVVHLEIIYITGLESLKIH